MRPHMEIGVCPEISVHGAGAGTNPTFIRYRAPALAAYRHAGNCSSDGDRGLHAGNLGAEAFFIVGSGIAWTITCAELLRHAPPVWSRLTSCLTQACRSGSRSPQVDFRCCTDIPHRRFELNGHARSCRSYIFRVVERQLTPARPQRIRQTGCCRNVRRRCWHRRGTIFLVQDSRPLNCEKPTVTVDANTSDPDSPLRQVRSLVAPTQTAQFIAL